MAFSPFRRDDTVHEDRLREAERELDGIDREVARLKAVVARRRAVEAEVRRLRERLGARAALPLLDRIGVAAPCNASWDSMSGDERARHCAHCDKTVYNLSAMDRADAEAFLAERLGGEVCVRFYQRADGTVLTADCPVGVRRRRARRAVAALVGTAAMAMAGSMNVVQGAVVATGAHPPGDDVIAGDEVRATMGEAALAPEVGESASPHSHPSAKLQPKAAPSAPPREASPRVRMGKPVARPDRVR